MSNDPFMQGLERLQFKGRLEELFKAVAKQKWKVMITLWNPANGEEWEVSPAAATQTKKPKNPSTRVQVEVRDTPAT